MANGDWLVYILINDDFILLLVKNAQIQETASVSTITDMKNLLQNNDTYQTNLNGCMGKHTAALETLSAEQIAAVSEMFESLVSRQHSHNERVTTKLTSYIGQLDAQQNLYYENNLLIIEKVKKNKEKLCAQKYCFNLLF